MAGLPQPLSKLLANKTFEHYDDHTQPHVGTTVAQLSLCVVWMAAIVLWVMIRASKAKLLPTLWPEKRSPGALETADAEEGLSSKMLSDFTVNVVIQASVAVDARQDGEVGVRQVAQTDGQLGPSANLSATNISGGGTSKREVATKQNFSTAIPLPSIDKFLQQIILLGFIMFYFYLCDYRKVSF